MVLHLESHMDIWHYFFSIKTCQERKHRNFMIESILSDLHVTWCYHSMKTVSPGKNLQKFYDCRPLCPHIMILVNTPSRSLCRIHWRVHFFKLHAENLTIWFKRKDLMTQKAKFLKYMTARFLIRIKRIKLFDPNDLPNIPYKINVEYRKYELKYATITNNNLLLFWATFNKVSFL